jgi:hypothetical protein
MESSEFKGMVPQVLRHVNASHKEKYMKAEVFASDVDSEEYTLSDTYHIWSCETPNDEKLEILTQVIARTDATEEQIFQAIGCRLEDATDDDGTIEALENLLCDVIYTPEGATEGYTFGEDDLARELGYTPVDEDHAMDGMWIRT